MDSLNPEKHDRFRGQPKAWARTIQGIRNSVAAGIKTGFACCFTRDNVETVDEMVRFAIDLGCGTFAHFNFIPVGRGREMIDRDLTPDQGEVLLRKLQHHLEEGKIGVISTAPQFGRACVAYGPQDGFFAGGHVGRGKGRRAMVLSRYIGGCVRDDAIARCSPTAGSHRASICPRLRSATSVRSPFEKYGITRYSTRWRIAKILEITVACATSAVTAGVAARGRWLTQATSRLGIPAVCSIATSGRNSPKTNPLRACTRSSFPLGPRLTVEAPRGHKFARLLPESCQAIALERRRAKRRTRRCIPFSLAR